MDEQKWIDLSIRNVAINGKLWHLLKCAEECAELSEAILKSITKGESEEHIQEEMGDVEIALLNLSTIFGRGIVEAAKFDKLNRILRKVEEQEGEIKITDPAQDNGIPIVGPGDVVAYMVDDGYTVKQDFSDDTINRRLDLSSRYMILMRGNELERRIKAVRL